jgi:hypothetical protein
MNRLWILAVGTGLAVLGLLPASGQVEQKGKISADRLDALDKRGFFPPAFKAAVHGLVDTQREWQAVTDEKAKLNKDLPGLQHQAAEAQAQAVALRQELAKYDHPEENDFALLQARMNDSAAKPQDKIILAQAYVWTYPASSHEAEAMRFLQQVQKNLADQAESEKEAEAARVAAHAKLVQRAQARDLSPAEWRDFLRGMSQDDLIKLMGRPSLQAPDYWIYSGDWTTSATTHNKVGLQINFDAGRVLTVIEKPAQP